VAETVAEQILIFRIRYYIGITRQMRIVYDDVNYDIEAIAEIGRREGLEIVGRAKVD
jgi:head-tail adaptor